MFRRFFGIGWVFGRRAFEGAVELGERFEADFVGDLAEAFVEVVFDVLRSSFDGSGFDGVFLYLD